MGLAQQARAAAGWRRCGLHAGPPEPRPRRAHDAGASGGPGSSPGAGGETPRSRARRARPGARPGAGMCSTPVPARHTSRIASESVTTSTRSGGSWRPESHPGRPALRHRTRGRSCSGVAATASARSIARAFSESCGRIPRHGRPGRPGRSAEGHAEKALPLLRYRAVHFPRIARILHRSTAGGSRSSGGSLAGECGRAGSGARRPPRRRRCPAGAPRSRSLIALRRSASRSSSRRSVIRASSGPSAARPTPALAAYRARAGWSSVSRRIGTNSVGTANRTIS